MQQVLPQSIYGPKNCLDTSVWYVWYLLSDADGVRGQAPNSKSAKVSRKAD